MNIRNGNKSLLDLSTKYKRNSSGDDKEGEKEGGDGAMGHQKGFYLQNIFNNINAYLPKGSPPRKKNTTFQIVVDYLVNHMENYIFCFLYLLYLTIFL